ncbi:hypothetical protein F3K20_19505 [Streptomyces scabiei]|nr:hypothetical protein [Streptomyces sp. LBUM 1484]MBP5876551.1 hypothetical protein [Streptomyces sp. LBUM 1477]MBP5884307.1 hypothetical protein [Streptomyces sp. LBUM 1487]MBP5892869.1 hypothetical protein [Streptomyces sp. LBUM 1481]MBP5900324.1 hypothetical protein [Streptomyces sp. LBUM 1488]MBP5923135.1 hypothetical protein [Streptomyces sp. LBUM 1483]QTU46743.1 hypothetical protein F3K20_19505 [Streptomyces sp. LBUM 1482]QTU62737.1 hypothetical protein F3K22_18460 [Streptomyces sp. 
MTSSTPQRVPASPTSRNPQPSSGRWRRRGIPRGGRPGCGSGEGGTGGAGGAGGTGGTGGPW